VPPPLASPSVLTAELVEHDDRVVVSLRGALTVSSLPVLTAQFDQLGATSCREVVLDLYRLSALDPAGAAMLAGLDRYVRARGGLMVVRGADREVAAALGDLVDPQAT
jgi:anti-anti-sigma factor